MVRKRRHTTPQSNDSESGLEEASSHDEWGGLDDEEGSDASSEGHIELVETAEGTTNDDSIRVRAPPKGEELRDIKDATDLFRSTSFKLQVS